MECDEDEELLCSYCDERQPIAQIRKLIPGLSLLICDNCLQDCFRNAIAQGWILPKIDDEPT